MCVSLGVREWKAGPLQQVDRDRTLFRAEYSFRYKRKLKERNIPGTERLIAGEKGVSQGPRMWCRDGCQGPKQVGLGGCHVPRHFRAEIVTDEVNARSDCSVNQGGGVGHQFAQAVSPEQL